MGLMSQLGKLLRGASPGIIQSIHDEMDDEAEGNARVEAGELLDPEYVRLSGIVVDLMHEMSKASDLDAIDRIKRLIVENKRKMQTRKQEIRKGK